MSFGSTVVIYSVHRRKIIAVKVYFQLRVRGEGVWIVEVFIMEFYFNVILMKSKELIFSIIS
jgi:hypothetical protein